MYLQPLSSLLITAVCFGSALQTAAAQTVVRPDSFIRASDAQPYDALGYGLALDGNVLLVGARGSDASALNGGAVYAYTRGAAGWLQFQKIVFPSAQTGDGIGEALAIAGAVGVVGAPQRGASGSVFVLRFDGGAWFPVTEVSDASAGATAEFGSAVSCTADWIAVGAPASAENVGAHAGRVRMFARNGTQWNASTVLTAEYPDPGDRFGFAVAMDAQWLVVSAPGDDDAAVNAGAVWVYRLTAGAYVFAEKILPEGDAADVTEAGFGQAIDVANGVLIVGASRSDLAAPDAGAVFKYALGAKGSTLIDTLLPPATATGAAFGFSVATDGNAIVVGAPGWVTNGQMTGGAVVLLDGATVDGVLRGQSNTMTLGGTRVACSIADVIASAPTTQVGPAAFAGELLRLDRLLDCDTSGVPDAIEVAQGVLVDSNEDGTPDACQCLADLTGDGQVAAQDLAIMLGFWDSNGSGAIDADINDDAIVNAEDLSILLSAWGICP